MMKLDFIGWDDADLDGAKLIEWEYSQVVTRGRAGTIVRLEICE